MAQSSLQAERVNVLVDSVEALLSVTQPKSFVAAQLSSLPEALVQNTDFWRHLYASLADDAMLSVQVSDLEGALIEKSVSQMKMHGFTAVESTSQVLVGRKPAFKQGGTSLKNRKPRVEADPGNPWANLTS